MYRLRLSEYRSAIHLIHCEAQRLIRGVNKTRPLENPLMRKRILKRACLTLACVILLLSPFACHPDKNKDDALRILTVQPEPVLGPEIKVTGIPIFLKAPDIIKTTDTTFDVTVEIDVSLSHTNVSSTGNLVDDGVVLMFHDGETNELLKREFLDTSAWLPKPHRPVGSTAMINTQHVAMSAHNKFDNAGGVVIKARRYVRLLNPDGSPVKRPNGKAVYILTDPRHIAAASSQVE